MQADFYRNPDLLSVGEVAEFLGVSEAFLRQQFHPPGLLRVFYLGDDVTICRKDLATFVERLCGEVRK